MKTLIPLACLLIPFTVACGSSDEDTGETNGPGEMNPDVNPDDPPMMGTPDCDPNAEIPCIEGIAEPCDLDSGWIGDEYCLAEPDPSIGLQLHVGPTDYDNPDETDRFVIRPGEETNWAEVTETPNEVDVYNNGYYSFMRPGSHHFILYSLPRNTYESGSQGTGGGAESAVGALDGEFRAGATKPIQGAVIVSEDPMRQQGALMEAKTPVAVNLHFINTSDDILIQEIWINFNMIAREDIHRWSKPITWYGGLGMAIPPGAHEVVRSTECLPPPASDAEITVMTGHVHANTLRYNATVEEGGATDILFEDYDWHDPTQFMFLEGTENTAPDPSLQVTGAKSGILPISPTAKYYWECEIQNERDVVLTFSNQVYDGEMCNVFGFYSSPEQNTGNWMCASF